jgi:hypothetical protein
MWDFDKAHHFHQSLIALLSAMPAISLKPQLLLYGS